jgi:1,2-diacylglycerol 3-alpha-glucosyltransferase
MTHAGGGAFYHTQDVGLGRALARLGHTVLVYHFVRGAEEVSHAQEGNLHIYELPSRAVGQHSVHGCGFITADADAVICFSDNQLGFGRLKRRCDRLGVRCLPYVGVRKSHSANPLKRAMMDVLVSNERYYKHMTVLAKTPQVADELKAAGTPQVVLAPVGLDGEMLHGNCPGEADSAAELRRQLGLPEDGKILLYLARMVEEKRPLAMADIFARLYRKDSRCHLVAIGKGELSGAFLERLRAEQAAPAVTWLEQVPNSEIWRYYRAADVMVNLNTEEIYGMAILEAMYYGCPVVARRAPGPEYIIEDGTDGVLCDDDREVALAAERLMEQHGERETMSRNAGTKIRKDFLWEHTAEIIRQQLQGV